MAFLGRPSGGDSPFAIGDRALRDQSSPQPPQQRNPTPRKSNNPQRASFENNMPPPGVMATPSPYGSVSDEARRRYEERYAKKKAEDAAKAEAEAREAEEKERLAQAAAQRPQGPPAGPPQQQQYFDPPPRQGSGYQQRPPSLQPGPGPYSPNPQPQRWSNPGPQGGLSPQPQQTGFGGSQGHSSQGHGSRPASHQGHSGQFGGSQAHGFQAQPVTSPGGPGGMQWSQNAPPPPSQQWNRSQSPQNQAPAQWNQQQSPPLNNPPAQQWAQQQSPPPPPPPVAAPRAEDAELRNLFSQFDSSRSGSLNSYDLERLLAKDATMEAREDCVKMLMNIFDTDRSGSINFQEFEGLYRYIQDWHGIFLRFDRDGSGLIDRKELHQALLGFGFSLPLDMVRKLEKRFAPPPKPGHPPRKGISFDRFLMACVSVKHYTEAFRRTDASGSGRITLDYNQYMDIILDSPS